MTRWMGHWLMGVACIHLGVALVVYRKTIGLVWERGVFNTVVGDPVIGAVIWSLLFGCVAFAGGMAVDALERGGVPVPASLGGFLLALALIGIVLVPISGFWLLFPVAITIVMRSWRRQTASKISP